MRVATVACCLLAIVLAGSVWAEQIGGPSGPAEGQFNLSAESIFRDNVHGRMTTPSMLDGVTQAGRPAARLLIGPGVEGCRSLSTETFYGVGEYGITDRLSLRGKLGVANLGLDMGPGDMYDFGYGLAWAAGLRYRICAPGKPGTSFAISGQFAHSEPDDFAIAGGLVAEGFKGFPFSERFSGAKLDEVNVALAVGTTVNNTRPYAGIVWSHFDFDFNETISVAAPFADVSARTKLGSVRAFSFDKSSDVGAIVGLDQALGESGRLNLEARAFDEASFTASLGFLW